MAVCRVEKEREKVSAEPKHLSPTAEDSVNEVGEIAIKPDCISSKFRVKVEKAIEADNLCYDCETGFHYIRQ